MPKGKLLPLKNMSMNINIVVSYLRNCICLVGIMLLIRPAFSQDQQDFGIITQLNVQKRFANGFGISGAVRTQWIENASEFSRIFGDIGAFYDFSEKWQIGGGFRFIENKKKNNLFEDESRFYAHIAYETDITDNISLSWRTKIQRSYFNLDRKEVTAPTDTRLRNRIQANYQWNWYSSNYVSLELFTPLDQVLRYPFNQLRTYIGYQYRITRNHKVGVYYRYQKPLWEHPATTRHILGLEYSLKL